MQPRLNDPEMVFAAFSNQDTRDAFRWLTEDEQHRDEFLFGIVREQRGAAEAIAVDLEEFVTEGVMQAASSETRAVMLPKLARVQWLELAAVATAWYVLHQIVQGASPARRHFDGRLGEFEVERVLGSGGMGVVFRAWERFPRRRVALKVIRPLLAHDAEARTRFMRETNVAARIEHPNVLPLYAAGEESHVLYLAARYVEGTDLADVLSSSGRLCFDATVAVVEQVAAALDAAHAMGLVHRDVKPANILLTAFDPLSAHVYLTDFGLARLTEATKGLTDTGEMLGTPAYMAPEQLRGERVDHRVDVYALGCLAYECLAGAAPFARDDVRAVMAGHLFEPAPKLSWSELGLPPATADAVWRALAKAPENRYQACGDLAAALRESGRSRPPRPAGTGHGAPADRWGPLLAAMDEAGGRLTVPQIREAAARTGVDLHGFGGLARGRQPVIRSEGDMRILTPQGQARAARWREGRDAGRSAPAR